MDKDISLDFFNSLRIICLDYFFFVSLWRETNDTKTLSKCITQKPDGRDAG